MVSWCLCQATHFVFPELGGSGNNLPHLDKACVNTLVNTLVTSLMNALVDTLVNSCEYLE